MTRLQRKIKLRNNEIPWQSKTKQRKKNVRRKADDK